MIHWQKLSYYDLGHDQMHIWLINVDEYPAKNYEEYLVPEERSRASHFKFDKDRDSFIVSRASLRILLGRYLNCSPQTIAFQFNRYGKPELLNNVIQLKFNLSHSSRRAVVAITKEQEIGVDIEYMQDRFSKNEIVERYFSLREKEEYNRLSEDQKLQGFYNAWTRKEAFTKAIGQGMTYPLNQFDVNLTPNDNARLIAINGDEVEAKQWQLRGLVLEEKYCAAVSWQGKDKKILFYRFEDRN